MYLLVYLACFKNLLIVFYDVIFILNGNAIEYCKNYEYLGHIVNASLEDDEDIQSHMKKIYARGNKLINTFKHCSDCVKVTLFKIFVSNFYCAHLWCNYNMSVLQKFK